MDSPTAAHLRHFLDLGPAQAMSLTTDPMILNQWYQLHLQRLQTTVDQLGLQNYLAQGKISKTGFRSKI